PPSREGDRLRENLPVVRAPGARFASVRFVTGRLDPLASRDEFLELARRAAAPLLVGYRREAPCAPRRPPSPWPPAPRRRRARARRWRRLPRCPASAASGSPAASSPCTRSFP